MRKGYILHWRMAKAQASLRICSVLPVLAVGLHNTSGSFRMKTEGSHLLNLLSGCGTVEQYRGFGPISVLRPFNTF